jgi:hypothetical protein
LIPRPYLASLGEPQDADALGAMVNVIARTAGVSAEPAARALSAQLETPTAIGEIQISPLKSTRRLGFRTWWVENRSWLGRSGLRRLAIYADDPLAPAIRALQGERLGSRTNLSIGGSSSAYLRRRRLDAGAFAAVIL